MRITSPNCRVFMLKGKCVDLREVAKMNKKTAQEMLGQGIVTFADARMITINKEEKCNEKRD